MKTLIVGAPSAGSLALDNLFEQRGHEVAVVDCGEAARHVNRDAPDLVVIDMSEDVGSGLELLRTLTAIPQHPFLLAVAPLSLLEEAVEAGADDFISASIPEPAIQAHLTLAERRVNQSQEHRRSVEALKASHANLLSLIENTDDSVLFSDRAGFPLFFNSAYANIMKAAVNPDMKPGIKPHELLDDADERAMWDGFHRRVLGGERFTEEYSHQLPDGRESCIEVRYNPVLRDGEIIGFSEFSRDITDKKLVERQLREASFSTRHASKIAPHSVPERRAIRQNRALSPLENSPAPSAMLTARGSAVLVDLTDTALRSVQFGAMRSMSRPCEAGPPYRRGPSASARSPRASSSTSASPSSPVWSRVEPTPPVDTISPVASSILGGDRHAQKWRPPRS